MIPPRPQPPRSNGLTWHYGQADFVSMVELGWWHGGTPPDLRPHFHDDAQIVFVLAGARVFLVDDNAVTVPAGCAAYIPAGVVHASRAAGQTSICVNAYVPEKRPRQPLIFEIQRDWMKAGQLCLHAFLQDWESAEARSPQQRQGSGKGRIARVLGGGGGRIEDVAARFGRSREGFSRIAKRELGLPPHAFRMLTRLNRARQMLREGHPIATVAAETGFADQSHLTRLFRAAFGTTPGLYQRS